MSRASTPRSLRWPSRRGQARTRRGQLIAHPEEREQYAAAKFASAEQSNAECGRVMDYNQRKQPVIRDILERMFRAHGLID